MTAAITILNFMCHEDITISLDGDVGLVVGANGAGKTAIRDALEFAYLGTGKLRGIGTKKALAALSIREGEPTCGVMVELPLVTFHRTMKRDGSQVLTVSERDDPAHEWSPSRQVAPRKDDASPVGGLPGDIIRACLEPTGFYQLDERSRREMLINATSEQGHTADAIADAMRQRLEPESDQDQAAIDAAAKWAAADGFREAESAAEEKRRELKRELKALTARMAPPPPSELFEAHSIEEFETRLAETKRLHEAAIAAEAAGEATLEGQIAEAKAAAERLEAMSSPEPDPEAGAGLKAARTVLKDAQLALEQARRDRQATQAALDELNAPPPEPAAFTKPKKCPAVSFDFACPVKAATFKAKIPAAPDRADMSADIDVAQARVDDAQNQLDAASAALGAAWEQLATAEARAQAERDRAASEARHEAELKSARDRTQELEGQLLEARQRAAEAPEQTAADLAARVAKGTEIVEMKREWDHLREQDAADQAQRSTLEAGITRWDAIANELKPTGVETILGGGAREIFMGHLAAAQGLAGTVALTPEFDLQIQLDGAPAERDPLQLSTSQRLAVGVAVQHALARSAGFPLLVTDALDLFDPAHRVAWATFALALEPDAYDAVIGLATLGQPAPSTPPPGIQTIWLHEGRADYLDRGSE